MKFIIWLIGLIVAIISPLYVMNFENLSLIYKISLFLLIVFLIFLVYSLYNEINWKKKFIVYKKLYCEGKLRGMWNHHNDSLIFDRQIENEFKTSLDIDLKVSRGYRLFVEPNLNFYKCLHDLKIENKQINMRVLLLYPCLKSIHVKNRAVINSTDSKRNSKNIKEYIELGLDSLMKLYTKNLEQNNIKIDVRY